MAQFNLPKRKYSDGPKKAIGWRLPVKMLKELDKLAKDSGENASDVAVLLIDLALQSLENEPK